jgi:hypothetical protein
MLKAGLGSTEVCQYLTATHAQAETQRAGAQLPFIKCSPAWQWGGSLGSSASYSRRGVQDLTHEIGTPKLPLFGPNYRSVYWTSH